MKGRSSVIGATALAATAALGLPGVAHAQTADPSGQSEPARPGPGRRGPNLEKAATAFGLSVEDLGTKLHDGQTLAQVAEQEGVDVQTLIDALVADATARLDQAVTDGKLTADEAAARTADLGRRITDLVQNGPPAHPDGPPPRGAPRGRRESSSSGESS